MASRWPSFGWKIWRASQNQPGSYYQVRQKRLISLVDFARKRSPFYAEHYRQLPWDVGDLAWLPPVTKPQLMARFDEWVTDTAVSREGVERFVSDPGLVGRPYLNRYLIFKTSGTTGSPGIFLHDADALAIYDLLWLMRGWLPWVGTRRILHFLRPDFCEVFVMATGGHFAGAASATRLRSRYPRIAGRLHNLSVLLPLDELVAQLNQLQPKVIAIYPTALSLLAEAQKDGRLSLQPFFIVTSGEWLPPAARKEIAAVFNCPIHDLYGCSEFIYLAFTCDRGWLHLNADWLILEAVDETDRPVPPGKPSHTALLTNLANRVQPLIRYDLGDSITIKPEPCACGNPLPALRVEGRCDEILAFKSVTGTKVKLLPMALATVAETTPGVLRFQLIQTGDAALALRFVAQPGWPETAVWQAVTKNLRIFLASQGLPNVVVQKTAVPPRRDPHTGKFRQVWSEIKQDVIKLH